MYIEIQKLYYYTLKNIKYLIKVLYINLIKNKLCTTYKDFGLLNKNWIILFILFWPLIFQGVYYKRNLKTLFHNIFIITIYSQTIIFIFCYYSKIFIVQIRYVEILVKLYIRTQWDCQNIITLFKTFINVLNFFVKL